MEQAIEPVVAQPEEPVVQAAPEVSQIVADNLWGLNPTAYQNIEQAPPAAAAAQGANDVQPAATQSQDAEEVVDVNDYFKREFGLEVNEFRTKWEEYNKPKEPVQPQEQKWVYDDSKEEEIYNYINQKRQLDRLEKYDIANADQAAEIIRANLQFKHKDLQPSEIDRLFARQYSMPAQPQQNDLQTDDEFAAVMDQWRRQVQEKQQDMIIDAKLAKPELSQFKSQIVLPDIQKPQVQQAGPTQEDLAAFETARAAYLGALESGYQNFKGFNVTAKNGEVQLPISYNVSPEEQVATKKELEDFNVNGFFDKRWWDEKGNPHVTLMQEDLYLLKNRDKILQKTANEAAAQMYAYMIKNQNNINLKGVNPSLGPVNPVQPAPVNESQALAASIWSL